MSSTGLIDKPNLVNCFQFKGACVSTKWPIDLLNLSPIESLGFQTLLPSLVLPFLTKISASPSVQMDSAINGEPSSFVDSIKPRTKSSTNPSSSALPWFTSFNIVEIGLVIVSYAFKCEKST